MKRNLFLLLCTVILVLISAIVSFADTEEEPLGVINGQKVYGKDLPLKEHLFLYKKQHELENLRKRYFNEYIYKKLLSQEAGKDGLDTDEYLRTKVFATIPPITNKEVEEYIQKNKHKYTKFSSNMEQLRKRIRQGLLEERKDEKTEALQKELMSKADVKYRSFFIKKPRFDIAIEDDDQMIGAQDAKINFVVFMDFGCPYCKKFFDTLNAVSDKYRNQVKVIFKHFPLDIHRNAFQLAVAAECAGKQGRFFEYADEIYKSKSTSACRDCVTDYARKLDLDIDAFDECLGMNEIEKKVADDLEYGKKLHITSVPTLFVNGFPVIGNISQEELESIVDDEINEGKKAGDQK